MVKGAVGMIARHRLHCGHIITKFVRPESTICPLVYGISPEGIGSIGMLINGGSPLSKLTYATPEMQALVENIRPKGQVPRALISEAMAKNAQSEKLNSGRVGVRPFTGHLPETDAGCAITPTAECSALPRVEPPFDSVAPAR